MSRPAVHSGKVLAEEFAALGVSPAELARQIDFPANRISQIINGKRAITGDTALRLARRFRTSLELGPGLQVALDVRIYECRSGGEIAGLPPGPVALRPQHAVLYSEKGH